MKLAAIDWAVVMFYMVLVVWIGIRATKKIKDTDDFYLAGRELTQWQAGASLAASDMGASVLVGMTGWAYSQGMTAIWWMLLCGPILFGMAHLVGRMRGFNLTTVPEYLERRYGPSVRLLAAILHTIGMVMYIASNGVVAAYALHAITGLDQSLMLVAGIGLIILYTYAGGFRAVVSTDILQFYVLMVGTLVMGFLAYNAVGGYAGMKEALPASYFGWFENGIKQPISFTFFGIYVYGTGQFYLQRIFAAKDVHNAKFSYYFCGTAGTAISFPIVAIGLAAAILYPGIENSDTVMPIMIRDFLPIGLSGLILAALFAAVMSSADSFLSAGSTMFTVDIYKRFIKSDGDEKHYLKVSRYATLGIGVLALIFGLQFENVIKVIIFAGTMYSGSVFFPLILGIFWKRGTAIAAFCAILAGATGAVLNKYAGFMTFFSPIIVGSFIALAVFIIVSLLSPKPSEDKFKYMYNYSEKNELSVG